jgi:integrase
MPAKPGKSKKFPKGGWEIDVRVKGEQRLRYTFATEKEANEAEIHLRSRALNKSLGLASPAKIRLKHLVERHLAEISNRPHYANIKTVLEKFCRLVGGETLLTSIRSADLMKYVSARRKDKPARANSQTIQPQTINREMTEIKAMLNSAWKYYPEMETFRCPRVERLPEPEIRVQAWSDEEIIAVLNMLLRPANRIEREPQIQQRHTVAELFVLCLETGMRAGEARVLKRSQIDFRKSVINVTSYKGKKIHTRKVAMNETARKILTRRAAVSEIIFPSIVDAKKPMSTYHRCFRHACELAGVRYGQKLDGALRFYDARKTFENNALDRGASPAAVAKNQGHSVQTMAKHYIRITEEQRREVAKTEKNFGQILDNSLAMTIVTTETIN